MLFIQQFFQGNQQCKITWTNIAATVNWCSHACSSRKTDVIENLQHTFDSMQLLYGFKSW